MTPSLNYFCPGCDSDLVIDADMQPELVTCPECKQAIRISYDADYEDGRWIDCTKLNLSLTKARTKRKVISN